MNKFQAFIATSLVAFGANVQAFEVSGGLTHTVMVGDDNALYTSGANRWLQLGHSNVEQGFKKVEWLGNTVTDTDAIKDATLAVANGKVYAFGRLYSTASSSFTSIGLTNVKQAAFINMDILMLTNDGDVYQYSASNRSTKQLAVSNITKIDGGMNTGMALDSVGNVYVWGTVNQFGQLGDGSTASSTVPTIVQGVPAIQDVTMASFHSVLLDFNGNAWSFGLGESGRLGNGSKDNNLVATLVEGVSDVASVESGSSQTLFLKTDGTVFASGYFSYQDSSRAIYGQSLTPIHLKELTNIQSVHAGDGNQMAFFDGSAVYGLGNARNKQLDLVVPEDNNGYEVRSFVPMVTPTGSVEFSEPQAIENPTINDVQPGGSYIITGGDFGTESATVSMDGFVFDIKSWEFNEVHIENPPLDMEGYLVLTTADGRVSNEWYVQLAKDAPSDTPLDPQNCPDPETMPLEVQMMNIEDAGFIILDAMPAPQIVEVEVIKEVIVTETVEVIKEVIVTETVEVIKEVIVTETVEVARDLKMSELLTLITVKASEGKENTKAIKAALKAAKKSKKGSKNGHGYGDKNHDHEHKSKESSNKEKGSKNR